MGHIAMFTLSCHGHVNPTLGLVSELVARGHRVSFAATDEFHDAVVSTGADVLPYEGVIGRSLDLVIKPPGELSAEEFHESILALTEEGLAPLDTALTTLDDDPPDLVLHDFTSFHTGRLLARRWGVPAVVLCTTLVFTAEFNPYLEFLPEHPPIDPGHPALVRERELMVDALGTVGRAGDDPEAAKSDTGTVTASLVFVPRILQPGIEHFGAEWAFVGPCGGDRSFQGRFVATKPRDATTPLVVISFGSFGYAGQPEFFADCVREFADRDCHVVLVLGNRVAPDDLEPLPPNIEAHRWVAQLDLLGQADVLVSHAGMGSVIEALSTATPLVLMPQLTEQDLVARQVAAHGVARVLPRADQSAALVRAAVEDLRADPDLPGRLASLRATMLAEAGSTRAADVVDDVLAPTRAARA